MPNFEYIALNEQNKKLSGVITAVDIEDAKAKLRDIKLSIVELQESQNNQSDLNSFNYKFQGTNSENKTVKGTIEAQSKAIAIRTLLESYDIQVQYLSNIDANQTEFLNSAELIQEIIQKIQSQTTQDELSKFKDNKNAEEKIAETDIMGQTIQILKYILTNLKEEVKKTTITQLQDNLTTLEKLKFSKNKEKNEEFCQRILKLILDQSIFKDKIRNKKAIAKIIQDASLAFYQEQKSSLLHLLQLFGSTKSTRSRKIFLTELLRKISQNLTSLLNSTKVEHPALKILNQNAFLFFSTYLGFYFVSVFLGNKISSIQLPNILYVYNTKILIFVIIACFLWQICLSCNQRFFPKKHHLQNLNTIVCSFCFILFITNF